MRKKSAKFVALYWLITVLGCGDDGGSEATEKIVFISSSIFSADLGGPAGADEKCQALADAADVRGVYMAWVADLNNSPALDFTRSRVPYVLVDGTIIADDWDDLTDGRIQNPINLDETGAAAPVTGMVCNDLRVYAHTGVFFDGTTDRDTCSGWTANSGAGTWGAADRTDGGWSGSCSAPPFGDCGLLAALYCFEQ